MQVPVLRGTEMDPFHPTVPTGIQMEPAPHHHRITLEMETRIIKIHLIKPLLVSTSMMATIKLRQRIRGRARRLLQPTDLVAMELRLSQKIEIVISQQPRRPNQLLRTETRMLIGLLVTMLLVSNFNLIQ